MLRSTNPQIREGATKVCLYGAGAIGGYLGVQLAGAGADVSLVARGAHLAAMRENGVKLLVDDEERAARPPDTGGATGPCNSGNNVPLRAATRREGGHEHP